MFVTITYFLKETLPVKKTFLLKRYLIGFCAIGCLFYCSSCKKSADTAPSGLPSDTPTTTLPVEKVPDLATIKSWLVDKNATNETASLFYNMKKLGKTHIMFGHQDDTYQGNNQGQDWHATLGASNTMSDVRNITGVYPAVYGHDYMFITDFQIETNQWFKDQSKLIHDLTVEAYERGGVNTFCWHCQNQVSKGSFYWKESPVQCVPEVLPGGSYHKVFDSTLERVADFAKSLVSNGVSVPIIFRPWHEADGNWFWWGAGHCTPSQYKELYQYTVTFLRDSMGVHNFLYEWSPGPYTSEAAMNNLYPGDDYVDIIGCDNYFKSVDATVTQSLKLISDYAKKHNKVAALAETGLDKITNKNWYTQVLLKALQSSKMQLAYTMVWYDTKNDYYIPYKGHPAESDFQSFKDNSYTIFADKLPDMYHIEK